MVGHKICPYLLRNVTSHPHIWGVTLTGIRMFCGWFSFVAIMDCYSPVVFPPERDGNWEMPFVHAYGDRALETATPVIWNSDQGAFLQGTTLDRLGRMKRTPANPTRGGKDLRTAETSALPFPTLNGRACSARVRPERSRRSWRWRTKAGIGRESPDILPRFPGQSLSWIGSVRIKSASRSLLFKKDLSGTEGLAGPRDNHRMFQRLERASWRSIRTPIPREMS